MKANTSKGFTLIELIMVIVILGILAAIAVPKFFDLSSAAHYENQRAVLGNIRAGMQLHAANALVKTGKRTFPNADDFEQAGAGLALILDEVPENWTIVENTTALKTDIVYTGGVTDTTYTLTTSADSSSFEIGPAVGGI